MARKHVAKGNVTETETILFFVAQIWMSSCNSAISSNTVTLQVIRQTRSRDLACRRQGSIALMDSPL